METKENIRVAMANLKANKVRTVFSMLGIIIGTCSVIVVISMVNGTRVATLDQLRAGKDNLLILRPKFSEAVGRFGQISLADVERIRKCPHVFTAFPDATTELEARGRYGKKRALFFGVNYLYTTLYKYKLLSGRFFTMPDTEARPSICVVSDRIAQKLFGFDYPIGQRVRLGNGALEVVGVFRDEERLRRMDQNGDILVPLNTLLALMPEFTIYGVQIRAQPGHVDKAKKEVQDLINANPADADLLELSDIRDYFKDTEKWARSWLLQMSIIAGISLLVGGVGLMNVMLISVTERTHEIGLRKALGANSRMILEQFLVESVSLSGLGGLLGVGSGLLISYGLHVLSHGKILIEIMPLSVVVSFLFSLAIGVIFGLFPASKAAHMSPVEALRYE